MKTSDQLLFRVWCEFMIGPRRDQLPAVSIRISDPLHDLVRSQVFRCVKDKLTCREL
jgi:hypothetical protein